MDPSAEDARPERALAGAAAGRVLCRPHLGAYRIRREPAAHCLATVEAVVQVPGSARERSRALHAAPARVRADGRAAAPLQDRPSEPVLPRAARPAPRPRPLATGSSPKSATALVAVHVEANAHACEARVVMARALSCSSSSPSGVANGERFEALLAAASSRSRRRCRSTSSSPPSASRTASRSPRHSPASRCSSSRRIGSPAGALPASTCLAAERRRRAGAAERPTTPRAARSAATRAAPKSAATRPRRRRRASAGYGPQDAPAGGSPPSATILDAILTPRKRGVESDFARLAWVGPRRAPRSRARHCSSKRLAQQLQQRDVVTVPRHARGDESRAAAARGDRSHRRCRGSCGARTRRGNGAACSRRRSSPIRMKLLRRPPLASPICSRVSISLTESEGARRARSRV